MALSQPPPQLSPNLTEARLWLEEDGTVLEANPAACALVGAEASAMVGRELAGLHTEPDANRLRAALGSLRGTGSWVGAVHLRRLGGGWLGVCETLVRVDPVRGRPRIHVIWHT